MSCCGNAEKKPNNKHNVKSTDIQLFDFTICFLSVSPFRALHSVCCTFLYFGRVCEHKHTGGAVWWQNVAGGKTVGTPSHWPQWLPFAFPTYTHILWQRIYCHSDTLNTLSERMVLFFFTSEVKNRVQEGGREKEGTQNHVRPPQGRFGIV